MLVEFFGNTSLPFKGFSRFACMLVVLGYAGLTPQQSSADPEIPAYADPRERIPVPDLSVRPRIRFLVTTDFPPFSFIDRTGRLAGFHVDLARALCSSLSVMDKCQIQAVPFEEIGGLLLTGQAEIAAAGLAMNAETRERYAFSRTYLEFPARFVVRRDRQPDAGGLAAEALSGKRVGVMQGSAHEALLRSWFPGLRPVVFTREEWLRDAVMKGAVDAVFDDGLRLSFFLASEASENCCTFFDGPYIARDFLGEGLALAAAPRSQDIVRAFDHALQDITRTGRFAELYLRWFPEGLY